MIHFGKNTIGKKSRSLAAAAKSKTRLLISLRRLAHSISILNIRRARFFIFPKNRWKTDRGKRIETWFSIMFAAFLRGYRYLRAFFVSFLQF